MVFATVATALHRLALTRTRGRAFAELEAVCREAALGAIREDVAASTVAQRHFDAARAAVTPLLTPQSLAAYEAWNQPAATTAAKTAAESKAPAGAALPPDGQPTECKQQ